jgi:nucleoside-triphosphatase THEP1
MRRWLLLPVVTKPQQGEIYILTGEYGAGKSVVCARVAERARGSGHTVRGLLTERAAGTGPHAAGVAPAYPLNGTNSGAAVVPAGTLAATVSEGQGPEDQGIESRFVVDLSTGERFPFGSRGAPCAGSSAANGSAATTDEALPGWQLGADAWARGNRILLVSTPCDLLIVDELGPLELRAGRGWIEAFAVLGSRDYRAALVVCRPWLVDELIPRLGSPAPKVIEVEQASRDTLPARICRELLGPAPRGRQPR